MKLFQYLCRVGLHAWGHEVEAKRYHHNKRFDKTTNAFRRFQTTGTKVRAVRQATRLVFPPRLLAPADPGRDLVYEGANLDMLETEATYGDAVQSLEPLAPLAPVTPIDLVEPVESPMPSPTPAQTPAPASKSEPVDR